MKKWISNDSPLLKKAKPIIFVGKCKVFIFWDASEILYIDYYEKDQIIHIHFEQIK